MSSQYVFPQFSFFEDGWTAFGELSVKHTKIKKLSLVMMVYYLPTRCLTFSWNRTLTRDDSSDVVFKVSTGFSWSTFVNLPSEFLRPEILINLPSVLLKLIKGRRA